MQKTILGALAILGLLLCTGAGTSLSDAQSPETPVVIVGRDSPMNALGLRDLKRLFLGESVRGPDGERLIPFNFPAGHPTRVRFDRRVLGMEPGEVGRYWVDRRIRGQGHPPRTVPRAELVRRVVGALDGAVGYVPASELTAEVKALRIDGHGHDERGYLR